MSLLEDPDVIDWLDSNDPGWRDDVEADPAVAQRLAAEQGMRAPGAPPTATPRAPGDVSSLAPPPATPPMAEPLGTAPTETTAGTAAPPAAAPPPVSDKVRGLIAQATGAKPKAAGGLQVSGHNASTQTSESSQASRTTKSVEGGPTPEQARQRLGVEGRAMVTADSARAEQHRAAGDTLGTQATHAMLAADTAERNRLTKERELDAKRKRNASMRSSMAAESDAPINPDRYMQNKSTFGKISMFLSAGMYGFLNPGSGKQAPVLDYIQQAIGRDIEAQKTDLKASQGRRQNRLSQLRDEHGDFDIAEQRLRLEQTELAFKQAKSEKMTARSQQEYAAADAIEIQLGEKVAKLQTEIMKTNDARPVEVTESTSGSESVQTGESVTSARPKPVGGGGSITKQLQDRVKQLDAMTDIQLHEDYGLSRKDLATLEKYREQAKPFEDMLVGTREVFSSTGLHVDRNGKVTANGNDVSGIGAWDQVWRDTAFSNAPNADTALGFFKAKLRNSLTGAAASPEEDKKISNLVETISEDNFAEKVGALHSYFNNRINAIASPQNVRDAYSKMQVEATNTSALGAASGPKPITDVVPLDDERGSLVDTPSSINLGGR